MPPNPVLYARAVSDTGRRGVDLDILLAIENAAPVDAVEAVTEGIRASLAALSASFLVADLSGRALVRLAHVQGGELPGSRRQDDDVATVLPFDGGPQEQVLRAQTVQVHRDGPGFVVMAPVTERGEVIGLLEIRVLAEPDQVALEEMSRAAHALAFAVIAARRHTDLFEWGQRTAPFTLAAEIQRRLLPGSFTCEAGAFTLSAWLEPAASVAGDTFDYSVARDLLHLSMTDAMGHDVASALTATLCVGSLRNTRRQGVSLLEQADAVNRALAEHSKERFGFASGLLGRLDLQTGVLTLVNAGHIPPLLVRDGTVLEVTLPIDRPFGLMWGQVYRATEVSLQPGDRLVLVTDGMVERRAAALNLTARLAELAALHPREVVRSLADTVLEVAGPALSDDATLLVLDWYGDHGSNRSTTAGADPDRASTPHPA
jgi:serine phosphatase RsbU (regulator of sigma subunit)